MDGPVPGLQGMEHLRGGTRGKNDRHKDSRSCRKHETDAASGALAPRKYQATGKSPISTGMEELDRVLGGGIVTGSLVLVGGDPGIGKSTPTLQVW